MLDKYVQYVHKHFDYNVTRVFVGYTDYKKNIKASDSRTIKTFDHDDNILIIETIIEQFKRTNTTILLGEDVDFLILLAAQTPIDKIIDFLKPRKAHV